MNMKTLAVTVLTSSFALAAIAPAFAAGDPAKAQKRVERLIKRADTNKDGRVSRTEMKAGFNAAFRIVDANGDGRLTKAEIANARTAYKAHRKNAGRAAMVRLPTKSIDKRFARIDVNGDGVLSKSELNRVAKRMFKRGDKNRDGYISASDFRV